LGDEDDLEMLEKQWLVPALELVWLSPVLAVEKSAMSNDHKQKQLSQARSQNKITNHKITMRQDHKQLSITLPAHISITMTYCLPHSATLVDRYDLSSGRDKITSNYQSTKITSNYHKQDHKSQNHNETKSQATINHTACPYQYHNDTLPTTLAMTCHQAVAVFGELTARAT
jgi:hypothetical protein